MDKRKAEKGQKKVPGAKALGFKPLRFKAIVSFIFIATMLVVLLAINRNYMRKTEELTLFLPTWTFLCDCLRQPGGLLTWAGSWLTQFFYHPLIGALAYTAALYGLGYAAYKAFRLQWQLFALALMPSALMAISYLSLGYVIFSLKSPGVAYAGILGTGMACLLLWAYRIISNHALRIALIVCAVVLGYPLFGYYALLGAAMCAVYEAACRRDSKALKYAAVIIAIVLIAAVPYACYRTAMWHLPGYRTYISGLPAFVPGEGWLWVPYLLLSLLLLLGSACAACEIQALASRKRVICSIVALVAIVGGIFVFNNTDPNFRLTLDMDRALRNGQWQQAERMILGFKHEPTRLNTMLGYVAAMRMGHAEENLFAMPRGNAEYLTTTPRQASVMRDAVGQLINYHFGRVNNAYRWGIEDMVEYGAKPMYLENMVKCCLINGEYALADKYLSTLEQTMYHKQWANVYRQLLENPHLLHQSPELSGIQELATYGDELEQDGGNMLPYIFDASAYISGGSQQAMRLSALSMLIEKDLDGFATRLRFAGGAFPVLPKHYQEAIVLWSFVNGNDVYRSLPISQQVMQRFQTYLQMRQGRTLDQIEAYSAASFPDTYWHYYFFE